MELSQGRYTPHKGRFEYVDTSKMSNKELKEYNCQKKNTPKN